MNKCPYATPEESASVIKRLPPEKSKALTYMHQRMDELHCHEQGASAEFVVIKVQEIALDVIEQRDALLEALQNIICAQECYKIADAMLRAREVKE